MAGRSRARSWLAAVVAIFGIVALLFAAWMFSAVSQGGMMAGYARDLGNASLMVGVVALVVAIVIWWWPTRA